VASPSPTEVKVRTIDDIVETDGLLFVFYAIVCDLRTVIEGSDREFWQFDGDGFSNAEVTFTGQESGNLRHSLTPTVYCLSTTDSLVSNSSNGKMSDEKNLRSLGVRIREIRKELSLSQEALAERAEIHVNHLRRIELGQANPTYLVLLRLSRALDVPLPKLLSSV
jgi:DNA-binding XRE family transcriptional regulator